MDAYNPSEFAMIGAVRTVTSWPKRRWLAAAGGTAFVGLAIGIPTDLVDTGLFTRMTPVRWWDYPLWLVSAALAGLVLATYVSTGSSEGKTAGRTAGASVLSVFAVGCPVCNKLVVAVLGFSGALTYFEPIQPLLGLAGVALLAHGLRVRIRGERSCALMPATADATSFEAPTHAPARPA